MTTASTSTTRTGRPSPAWWLIFTRELSDLWIGGKALILILIYSAILGAMAYLLASNSELSLIPPKEMVYETLKNAMAVSLFICLVIGADSISGERERATLEGMLLTPASRRQIVVGKFLAGITPWFAAMIIVIPFMHLLSQGDEILWPAVFWGALLGSVLAPAYLGLGMLISFFSASNKTSYFVSLGMYILFLVPAQLPGRAQTGAAGQFVQWVNPVAAVNHFLSKHLVNYRTVAEFANWLISPVVFCLIVLTLLFLVAAPGLRFEPGRSFKLRKPRAAATVALLLIATLIAILAATPAFARQEPVAQPLQVDINLDAVTVKTSDEVQFMTRVTNNDTVDSPPLIVAMNIINLDSQGDVVDPEDWSPQRTQYVQPLGPGKASDQNWIINTILDGDYMVYMVVIPEPESSETTSQPVASQGIHLTVTPFTRINPLGVLPYAIGIPLLVLIGVIIVFRARRKKIDAEEG